MDATRFDAVTGILGRTHNRRGALRVLGGAIAAAALGRAESGEAKKAGKNKKSPNAGNAEFCRTAGCRVTTHGDGGISCGCGGGMYIECSASGRTCYTFCNEAEGCTCLGNSKGRSNYVCERGKPVSEPAGPEAPIADEVKPTTGGGSTRPSQPGQGAAAGGETVKT